MGDNIAKGGKGGIITPGRVKNYSKEDLQFILENNKELSYLNLDWDLVRKLRGMNEHPLSKRTSRPDVDVLKVVRDPNNFHFTCKYILNKDILPFQNLILKELWNRPFPMLIGSRGASKTFTLGIYCVLRALINQGCGIVITGAAFRQAKVVFEYIEQLWATAPVLRDICNAASDKRQGPHHDSDRYWFGIGESVISALPIGDGSKIRGYRANYLVSDEFASQNPEIYENVISGFAFVSSNPVIKVKEAAEIETLKELNLWTPEQETKLKENYKGNQSILAGTAYYSWNHFYTYYKKYKSYLDTKGDPKKLEEIFQGEPPEGFDWKDYSIIRLPLELVPKGMMDDKQISRSKATTHSTNYQMEFGAIFANDSNGFFKRSLIESCVTKDNIAKASGLVKFKATVSGNPSARYVYGIDPASEEDKFSIVVLEMHEDHNRIVYCWTTNKEDHRAKMNAGVVRENDFYSYINRKIRTLMKVFPCAHISMDSQGGGNSVMEIFRDKSKLEPGEQPLLLITKDHPLSDKKERDCDGEEGLHIVELISFAKYEWTSSSNHNMRMDFEHKNLLFPYFDPMQITIAASFDEKDNRLYDTLEDCVMEIEELKDELATIVVTATTTGKEHFDTPEIRLAGTKKGRMRKDRYSALLMANSSARVLNIYAGRPVYVAVGGFVGSVAKPKEGARLYNGPAWFTTQMSKGGGGYGGAVSRKGV